MKLDEIENMLDEIDVIRDAQPSLAGGPSPDTEREIKHLLVAHPQLEAPLRLFRRKQRRPAILPAALRQVQGVRQRHRLRRGLHRQSRHQDASTANRIRSSSARTQTVALNEWLTDRTDEVSNYRRRSVERCQPMSE